MLLNKHYGSLVMEFPPASLAKMLRKAIEQDLRDELKPIWLARLVADKLTGEKTPDFEEVYRSLFTDGAGSRPSEDTLAEIEAIVKRDKEAQDGVDIPAVR
jgi:hypothetical protein